MAKIRVPKQVLLDGAQMSMAAMLAEVLGFLKERKIPVRDLIAYIGEKFEGSWEGLEGRGADEAMEHFLTLEVLPRDFGVTQKEYDSIYAMFEPAAKAIGLELKHHSKDGQVVVSLAKAPSRA